jgi:hypothetical protein
MQDNNAFKEKLNEKIMTIGQEGFDRAVKSLTEKLQPEYERIKKLKESPAMSVEREMQIHDAKSRGLPADFQEQARAEQEINNYNNKIEGIAMALNAISTSYGIHTFISRRFRSEYLV